MDEHNDLSEDVSLRWQKLLEEIERRLGAGAAADARVRAEVERRTGRSVGGAMVHAGPLGGQLAASLEADAFTVGEHVVGSTERVRPDTRAGAALLGHELVHAARFVPGPQVSEGLVQRAPDDGEGEESEAQSVEGSLMAALENLPVQQIDAGIIAEKVYRLMVDDAIRDRERTGRII